MNAQQLDDLQFCLASSNIKVLPHTVDNFVDELTYQERKGRICLVPSAQFYRFHLDLRRKTAA